MRTHEAPPVPAAVDALPTVSPKESESTNTPPTAQKTDETIRTRSAPDVIADSKEERGRLQIDVDVPSLIRVDGRIVARGQRAALDVASGVVHRLVVSSARRGIYRDKVVVHAGSTLELAVRLGARPSVNRRRVQAPQPAAAPSQPQVAPAPPSNDPNYTLNPFSTH